MIQIAKNVSKLEFYITVLNRYSGSLCLLLPVYSYGTQFVQAAVSQISEFVKSYA